MRKLKQPEYTGFPKWKNAVKQKGAMTEEIFNKIFQHYCTIHKKSDALKYAMETTGKIEQAAGIKKTTGQSTVFEYKDKKVNIPNLFLDEWVEKAKELGVIPLDLHHDVGNFVWEYTDLGEKMDIGELGKLVFALDAFIAKKAGFKVDPESPLKIESGLKTTKNSITLYSERYGSMGIPLHLYYKWFDSFLAKGYTSKKDFSEMYSYAGWRSIKKQSAADLGFYYKMFRVLLLPPEDSMKQPAAFTIELEKVMKAEAEKLSKLKLKLPPPAGSVAEIKKGKVGIENLKGIGSRVDIDDKLYHLIYSGTVKNKGKAPGWAGQKLYSGFVKKEGEDRAYKIADALVLFFEAKVAEDAEMAGDLLKKKKKTAKLKVIPKK